MAATYGISLDYDIESLNGLDFEFEGNDYHIDEGEFYKNTDNGCVLINDSTLEDKLESFVFELDSVKEDLLNRTIVRIGEISDNGDLSDYVNEL